MDDPTKTLTNEPKLNLHPTPSHNQDLTDRRLIEFVRALARLAAERDFKSKKH